VPAGHQDQTSLMHYDTPILIGEHAVQPVWGSYKMHCGALSTRIAKNDAAVPASCYSAAQQRYGSVYVQSVSVCMHACEWW